MESIPAATSPLAFPLKHSKCIQKKASMPTRGTTRHPHIWTEFVSLVLLHIASTSSVGVPFCCCAWCTIELHGNPRWGNMAPLTKVGVLLQVLYYVQEDPPTRLTYITPEILSYLIFFSGPLQAWTVDNLCQINAMILLCYALKAPIMWQNPRMLKMDLSKDTCTPTHLLGLTLGLFLTTASYRVQKTLYHQLDNKKETKEDVRHIKQNV